MSFLERLFGRTSYPDLSEGHPLRQKLGAWEPQLRELAEQMHAPMEILPADQEAFVFVGKPPKRFNLAWIHDGKIETLKNIEQERHIPAKEMGRLVEDLAEAYSASDDGERYQAEIAGAKVIVNTSDQLEHRVDEILNRVVH